MSIFDVLAGGASLGTSIGTGAGIAGLGLEAVGAFESFSGANKAKEVEGQMWQVQQQEAATEQQQDDLRRQSMELTANRQKMQALRNAQQSGSLALAASVNQGAQFSSSLSGAQAQISGESTTNLLGIEQNLAQGEKMFDLNRTLNQEKLQYAGLQGQLAGAQGQMSMGSGLSGLGGNLMGSMNPLKNIFG
jgi:hypothetical protein